MLSENNGDTSGLSSDCPKFADQCQWLCCEQLACSDEHGRGIYLYPNELSGKTNTDHLDTRMTLADGGKIVVCRAKNLKTCDNKYKPVDCKLFPIFPKFKNGDLNIYFHTHKYRHGTFCPFTDDDILKHTKSLFPMLLKISFNKTLVDFYNKRQLVGYVPKFTIKGWKSKFLNSVK